MTQHCPVPQIVTVHGYIEENGELVLRLIQTLEFPSRCSAEKFASEKRKIPYVSSVHVDPKICTQAPVSEDLVPATRAHAIPLRAHTLTLAQRNKLFNPRKQNGH